MSQIRLANPTILVNNNAIAIVPNSCTYTEGLGEQKVEPQSAGGNRVETVYSEDISSRMSTFKFEVANTEYHIELLREWKLNRNANAISATGNTFTRTFTNMALTSNYEVSLGADTNITVEFMGDPAV